MFGLVVVFVFVGRWDGVVDVLDVVFGDSGGFEGWQVES